MFSSTLLSSMEMEGGHGAAIFLCNLSHFLLNLLQTTCESTWRGRQHMVRVATGNLPGSLEGVVRHGMLVPTSLVKACLYH